MNPLCCKKALPRDYAAALVSEFAFRSRSELECKMTLLYTCLHFVSCSISFIAEDTRGLRELFQLHKTGQFSHAIRSNEFMGDIHPKTP